MVTSNIQKGHQLDFPDHRAPSLVTSNGSFGALDCEQCHFDLRDNPGLLFDVISPNSNGIPSKNKGEKEKKKHDLFL